MNQRRKRKLPWSLAARRFLLVVMTIYALYTVFNQQVKIVELRQEYSSVLKEIDYYTTKNAILQERIAYLQTDQYIEKAAREKLGLIFPGEVPYMTQITNDDGTHGNP
ncbi:MAG: FtsB family cell division protein [Bacillota bacterium]